MVLVLVSGRYIGAICDRRHESPGHDLSDLLNSICSVVTALHWLCPSPRNKGTGGAICQIQRQLRLFSAAGYKDPVVPWNELSHEGPARRRNTTPHKLPGSANQALLFPIYLITGLFELFHLFLSLPPHIGYPAHHSLTGTHVSLKHVHTLLVTVSLFYFSRG